jgi:ribosomal protein S18 acetylase RimI-like enzyme
MPVREIKLPDDFPVFSELLLSAFQYPDHPEWSIQQDEADALRSTVTTLQMIWPVFSLFKLFSPRMRDALTGFLWEEDGQVVGMATVSRRGSGSSWLVGNVAVLPDFRRRGIARELVKAGLALVRARGGDHVVLDVLAGNLPAYQLYQDLGFEHFSDYELFEGSFKQASALPKVPEGYRHKVVPMRDWKTSHDLAKKLTPLEVQRYDPVTKARYYTPVGLRIFAKLIGKLRGTLTEDFALVEQASGKVRAMGLLSAEGRAGRHSLALIVGEEQADLVPFMLDYMLYVALNLAADHKVEVSLPAWRDFARPMLLERGFEPRQRWHRLGMKLDS